MARVSGAALSALIGGIGAAIIGLVWLLFGWRRRQLPRCRHCGQLIEPEEPVGQPPRLVGDTGWQHQASGAIVCQPGRISGSWLAEP